MEDLGTLTVKAAMLRIKLARDSQTLPDAPQPTFDELLRKGLRRFASASRKALGGAWQAISSQSPRREAPPPVPTPPRPVQPPLGPIHVPPEAYQAHDMSARGVTTRNWERMLSNGAKDVGSKFMSRYGISF